MENNKRSFDIYADSASNVTEELIEKYDIRIVPYTCSIDGKDFEAYVPGVPFVETAKNFYSAMREGKDTKTTLVNAHKIITAVTPSLQAGRDVIFVSITSGLSGTYDQAIQAGKELKELFPDRKFIPVDSANAAFGEGLIAYYIAKLRDEGKTIDECNEWAINNRYHLHGVCTVDSLKYLKRGGRISSLAAIAGTILNIKPVLWGDDNEHAKLTVMCNERGRKKSIARMIEYYKQNIIDPENQVIAISHADCEEEALELMEKLKQLGAKEFVINYYDLCTGAHAGPGTLALFFLGAVRNKLSKELPNSHSGSKGKSSD